MLLLLLFLLVLEVVVSPLSLLPLMKLLLLLLLLLLLFVMLMLPSLGLGPLVELPWDKTVDVCEAVCEAGDVEVQSLVSCSQY